MSEPDERLRPLVKELDTMTAHLRWIWVMSPAHKPSDPVPPPPAHRTPSKEPHESFFGWLARLMRGR